jgi:hypothetical protein
MGGCTFGNFDGALMARARYGFYLWQSNLVAPYSYFNDLYD